MSTRTPFGLADDARFQFGVVAARHVIPLSEETVTVKLSAREGGVVCCASFIVRCSRCRRWKQVWKNHEGSERCYDHFCKRQSGARLRQSGVCKALGCGVALRINLTVNAVCMQCRAAEEARDLFRTFRDRPRGWLSGSD